MGSTADWVVGLVTFALVVACVAIHYAALSSCNRLLPRLSRPRLRVLVFIAVVLATHVMEIWLFGVGHLALSNAGFGQLSGFDNAGLGDYFYFSATAYTTLGFGDVVPVGPVRFLSAIEALVGLVLITWSASFTFLEMQRSWKER
jgi:hypothetical protein